MMDDSTPERVLCHPHELDLLDETESGTLNNAALTIEMTIFFDMLLTLPQV